MYDMIESKSNSAQKAAQERKFEEMCEIKDLLVLLVAKENMPIRIVESTYFAQLLQG